MDHLTALRVFCQVVEFNSFAEAGRQMGLSPAAISKNIRELEVHLATRLVQRTTRSMALTEAGILYYQQISRILEALDEADCSLSSLQHVPRGVLRVSAPMTLTLTCLSPAIPKFLTRYPELSLELHLEDKIVDVVKDGYDLVVRGREKLEDSSLIARQLMTMPRVVCGTPAYFERCGIPEKPEDLARHSCIQYSLSETADLWTFSQQNRTASVTINSRYKVTSSLAVRDALLGGFGLSLIPWHYVKDELTQGRLCTVLNEWTASETSVYAIYPSRQYISPKVRAFIDFLIEELT